MNKSLYGHTLAVVIVTIAAYFAWTEPKASSDASQAVTLVPGEVARLTEVDWHEERWDVAVTRANDEDFEVTVQKLTPPPPKPRATTDPSSPKDGEDRADSAAEDSEASESEGAEVESAAEEGAETDAAVSSEEESSTSTEPAAPAPTEPPKTFPASDKVTELLAKLAPLKAARSLGEVSQERLAAMGLDDPKSKLTLVFGDKRNVVEIGDATYGSGDLYARDASGEVYLVPASSVSAIRHGASALLDKNAVGVPEEKVTRLTITAGARGREVAQRYPEDKDKRFFSDPAEPEAKLETTTSWAERLWRLRVIDLLDEQNSPAPAEPPAVEVELFAGADKLGTLRFWTPDERVARATSSRFKQPFTVSKASVDGLLKDLDKVLGEGR